MRAALEKTPQRGDELYQRLKGIEARLAGIAAKLQGDPAPGRLRRTRRRPDLESPTDYTASNTDFGATFTYWLCQTAIEMSPLKG